MFDNLPTPITIIELPQPAYEDTLDVLRRARALITPPDSWTKFTLVDDKNRHCAIGAVMAVAGECAEFCTVKIQERSTTALQALLAVLPSARGDAIAQIADFNNDEGVKQEHVLRLFDRAIAHVELLRDA
jgi:hypothetical protein